MPNSQGIGIVWGIGTTVVSSGSVTVTGEDFKKEADKVEVKDSSGNVASIYYHNRRRTLGIKCYPSGEGADATALPDIGDMVVITAPLDADLAGNWLVDSVSKARKSDGIVEFDLGLVSYAGVTPAA